ncbi:MAG: CoA-binding protein [Chloroflexi bacterium]|nr:CoA-binding protein [Chloroflexota bacterium]
MAEIEDIIHKYRTIAVVGLSPQLHRHSYQVSAYMQSQGYRIVPVNPNYEEVLGEKCYPDLAAIPFPVEVVNIFRQSDQCPEIVAQALAIGAQAVWMQEGIVHQEAAASAREAGLLVVMDRCLLKEHRRLSRVAG